MLLLPHRGRRHYSLCIGAYEIDLEIVTGGVLSVSFSGCCSASGRKQAVNKAIQQTADLGRLSTKPEDLISGVSSQVFLIIADLSNFTTKLDAIVHAPARTGVTT